MLKRVYINTEWMRENLRDGGRRPVIGVEEVRADGTAHHLFDCMAVDFPDGASLVFRPDCPAAGGKSVVYIETFRVRRMEV